jgi:uncharacterized damage-inducible protein DinB
MSAQKEVWLRGPLNGTSVLLQPVAHALQQAREEINDLMAGFPDALLWEKPAGLASPAFHLQHLSGVLDRLFAYARGEQLFERQLDALKAEGSRDESVNAEILLTAFDRQVNTALTQLQETGESVLTQARTVGRAQLPSTVIGLYVHAAEHTMRHVGQLLVTVKVLKEKVA